jgi:hypothetical protein
MLALTRDLHWSAGLKMSHHSTNPQDHGWTYQGSNQQSRVDFYSKNVGGANVKMDYYPSKHLGQKASTTPADAFPSAAVVVLKGFTK